VDPVFEVISIPKEEPLVNDTSVAVHPTFKGLLTCVVVRITDQEAKPPL
jgi:hypothetical protein